MTRALRLFALFSALFVVAVRCSSGFPFALACLEASPQSHAVEICPATGEPVSEDTLAAVALDDDSDDGADPLVTPPQVEVSVLRFGPVSGLGVGTLAPQRALPSHAPSLERPPRA